MTQPPDPAREPAAEPSAEPGSAADAPAGPDLVEETRRIVGAVQEWMRRSADGVRAEGAAGAAPGAGSADAAGAPHTGSECEWCPICQLARAVRADRPELADKLGVAVTAVGDAVRALVEMAVAHSGDLRPARGPSAPQPAADRPRPRPRVEHIDLDGQD